MRPKILANDCQLKTETRMLKPINNLAAAKIAKQYKIQYKSIFSEFDTSVILVYLTAGRPVLTYLWGLMWQGAISPLGLFSFSLMANGERGLLSSLALSL